MLRTSVTFASLGEISFEWSTQLRKETGKHSYYHSYIKKNVSKSFLFEIHLKYLFLKNHTFFIAVVFQIFEINKADERCVPSFWISWWFVVFMEIPPTLRREIHLIKIWKTNLSSFNCEKCNADVLHGTNLVTDEKFQNRIQKYLLSPGTK